MRYVYAGLFVFAFAWIGANAYLDHEIGVARAELHQKQAEVNKLDAQLIRQMPDIAVEKPEDTSHYLVPAGVHDAEQFVTRPDKIVRKFYLKNLALALDQDSVYDLNGKYWVSYRIHDKIYWTRKPVKLIGPALALIGRKDMFVRARCGNLISKVPMSPTHAHDEGIVADDVVPPVETDDIELPIMLAGVQLPYIPDFCSVCGGPSANWVGPATIVRPEDVYLPAATATSGGIILAPSALIGGAVFAPIEAAPVTAAPEPGAIGYMVIGLVIIMGIIYSKEETG